MGQPRYWNNFEVTLHPDLLEQPLRWSQPRKIFVNSMSDLFHPEVPLDFIQAAFDVMGRAYWHTFQILTKRSDRLAEVAKSLSWHDNIWMGVSVENRDYTYRIEHLRKVPAAIRFLSVEPLLGPVHLNAAHLEGVHWVIVGGESGPRARRMNPKWAQDIQRQCEKCQVSFFFKQWGAHDRSGKRVGKKAAGRVLDGRTWDELPVLSNR